MKISANTTLRQLRAMTQSTKDMKKLPRPETLAKSKEEILHRAEDCGAVITIYKNGCILYEAEGHKTVFAVDRCYLRETTLVDAGDELVEKTREIDEKEYLDCPWHVSIGTVGAMRIDHLEDRAEEEQIEYHIGDENLEKDPALHSPSAEDVALTDPDEELEAAEKWRAERKEAVNTATAKLTDTQRQILKLWYLEHKSQAEIQEIMGISQPTVSCHVKAVREKYEKYCKKFLH